MNLIGLDIGTTTIGGVLYSLKERKTLRTEVRENRFLRENPEEYLQDPAAIEGQVRAILDELIEDSVDEIGGISLSAQMHGILYVDPGGPAGHFLLHLAKPAGARSRRGDNSGKGSVPCSGIPGFFGIRHRYPYPHLRGRDLFPGRRPNSAISATMS